MFRLPRRGPILCALAASLILHPSFFILPASAAPAPSAENSIVRVNVTSQKYNFFRPWQKDAPASRRALGAILENNQVLVTAELAANATYIELELPDTGEKTTAQVDAVDYEANLALLSPLAGESSILEGKVPLEIASDPRIGDTLEVWQIQDNGTARITRGELVNAEVASYFLSSSLFLSYQLKASLQYQSGSFTLPVIHEGRLAGLLLGYNSADQISKIVATPIIRHFLKEVRKDKDAYPGFPNLGIAYAQTLDDQLRGFTGLNKDQGGVYITRVLKDSSADQAGLEVGDVLLQLGDYAIDPRGNYDDPLYGKLNLSHIVRGNAYVGDRIPMKILRDGEVVDITATLKRKGASEYLVDPYMFDRGPKFIILGGLIFQELSQPYLQAWGDKWRTQAPFKLIHAQAYQEPYEEEGREKIVFLSRVLRTPTTLGYERLSHLILTQVNGKPVNSLTDLDAALRQPIDGIHHIEFSDFPKIIHVDALEAEQTNAQLQELGIARIKRLD